MKNAPLVGGALRDDRAGLTQSVPDPLTAALWLAQRGMLGVNTTSKPEPVLTSQQWQTMHSMAARSGGGGSQVLELRVTGSGSLYEQIKAGINRGELDLAADGKKVKVR